MKITDPDIIKNGEKDLIDAIKEDLDLEAIKEILKHQIAQTVLSAKGGQIIVHDNQIAFQMDFDLNLSGSLIFDRDGNYIPVSEDLSISDDTLPDDINLDDVSIDDALEEIDPESDLPETSDDDLFIPEDDTVQEELTDHLSDEELDIDLEEDNSPNILDQDLLEPDGLEDLLEADEGLSSENGLDDMDDLTSEQMETPLSNVDDAPIKTDGDDDIDGILQESRECWEQEKET